MGKEVSFKLDNCMDCPHHRVYPDPESSIHYFAMAPEVWCGHYEDCLESGLQAALKML